MCPRSANDQLMTKDQLAAKAKAMGYDVRGITARDWLLGAQGFR